MQKRGKAPFQRHLRIHAQEQLFDQQRMFGDRIWPVAKCLTVPARDERKTMRDILDLDIHGRRIQQVKSAA